MELFYELLLTAAFSLIAAFLLGKLFAANDPRREPDRVPVPAGSPAEEEEEEKIIEVDAVALKEERADVSTPAAAESWTEEEKVPASVVEEKPECLVEEEGVPVNTARELFIDVGLEEQKMRDGGEKQCSLTTAAAATEVLDAELEERIPVVEVKQHGLGAEAAPREVLDVGSEKDMVQAVGVKQHDLDADAALREVVDAGLEKERVQVVEVKQHGLASETAPREVFAVEEERMQSIEIKPLELAHKAAPSEVVDAELEEESAQVIDVHGLAAEVPPREVLDVALEEKEELQEQPVEEVFNVLEKVESKEEARCDVHLANQKVELVPKEEEFVVKKADEVKLSQEGDSNDKRIAQLPEKEVTLQGMPDEEVGAEMEFEEWEGIERSEVEKQFGLAAAFAASDMGEAALSKLSSDVQLQLQGLLKVAIDGPCYDSTQLLTLRPSSRAKWVAWQKLGNMHPEVAMEKYMTLLSENIPGWMGDKTTDTKKLEASDSKGPILTMDVQTSDQQSSEGNEDRASMQEGYLSSSTNPDKGQRPDVPAE